MANQDQDEPPGAAEALQVHIWPASAGRYTIVGRHGPAVDVRLENLRVSAQHVIFLASLSRPGFLVIDLGARNGTRLWVNGADGAPGG